MFKQFKYISIICIVLAFSVLALALAVGFMAINALRNSYFPDPLAGYEEQTETQMLPPPPINNEDNNLLPYQIRSDVSSDAVYLRLKSYGNYNGNSWGQATPYAVLIDEKYPATYLGTKFIEKWKNETPIALEIVPNNSPKVIPNYTAISLDNEDYVEEYDIPIDDVTGNARSSEYYRMYYYDYSDVSLKPCVPILEYESYEAKYRKFVQEEYLTLDEETEAYMLKIIEEQGFSADDEEIATKVAKYVMNLGEYSMKYDTALDQEENVAIAFIEKYKEGTCKHFSSVATLLFRALDIPARYTVGYMSKTEAGEWVQLTNLDAHAWVEVYVEGFGWKNIEVTPPRLDATVKINPVTVSKLFDGTPLYPKAEIEGFEKYEERGFTYEVVVSGEITEPGLGESTIESIKVFDSEGKDVTENFNFEFKTGDMIVFVGSISLESDDFTHVYNGLSPYSIVDKCRVVFEDGAMLPEGYTVSIIPKALPSTIGTHPHAFAIKIIDDDGDDVTDLYNIKNDFGSVKVTSNEIVLRAGSSSKDYDGAPLTYNHVDIISGVLADGDYLSKYTVVGSQTLPGSSPNVIDYSSIVISNSKNENVTSNYRITVEDGTLTVNFSD